MRDIVRDSSVGQLIRWLTGNSCLQYPDEKAGFAIPDAWNASEKVADILSMSTTTEATLVADQCCASINGVLHEEAVDGLIKHCNQAFFGGNGSGAQNRAVASKNSLLMASKEAEVNPSDRDFLVDWYGSDDADNPQNWSNGKRFVVTLIICLYTFVVYTTSAIYVSSVEGVIDEFHVTQLEASLGLSLYVLGYGMGPLIFSPLSEIPFIGRNPVYIITMLHFVIISIPTAFVSNLKGLVILRFLQGFFGSPCLASGGASIGDIYSLDALPYAMLAWVSASYCGPALGPLLSGFSVPVMGWRWSLFESIWASTPVLIVMFLFLPETSGATILLRRAQRLSKHTGQRFVSQSQLDQADQRPLAIIVEAIIKPLEITFKDPAVFFVQIYTAIIYGIYYSFFEVFPLVYHNYYQMSLGQIGLIFLCVLVACLMGIVIYVACLQCLKRKGVTSQEKRLLPALPASLGPTAGLFLFAWTARPSIHFIVPTIGISIYGASVFVVFQCLFIYIPLSYPNYAASLFAANDFFRSALACGSVLFANPLFGNLGVDKGVSVLGALSVIGIVGIWLLYLFGARLRSMSKFAA
ncbi:hypothetical protein HIM_11603 [Hirsutella minnesotensis 3608]|uniref:Major facilitator superfamily (MFS) profile domain-containing protein n=1 Tax=Hirsutella minnesotensis 3608 TaxID=1043627 RepID=A0A0F7ZFE5_9HYPO|nr:hypothetical protein HIM_11603 [Hirsutella minnesotensis 3608]